MCAFLDLTPSIRKKIKRVVGEKKQKIRKTQKGRLQTKIEDHLEAVVPQVYRRTLIGLWDYRITMNRKVSRYL